jgi:hypothetical protein
LQYDAKINLKSKSESELESFNKTSAIAIISKELTPQEIKKYLRSKTNPKLHLATGCNCFEPNASNDF